MMSPRSYTCSAHVQTILSTHSGVWVIPCQVPSVRCRHHVATVRRVGSEVWLIYTL